MAPMSASGASCVIIGGGPRASPLCAHAVLTLRPRRPRRRRRGRGSTPSASAARISRISSR